MTPIFTASYSALFKSFFDVLGDGSLTDMPVLIGATGGTERHSLALEHAVRPLLSYLRSVVVPTSVFAATSDRSSTGTADTALSGRIAQAAGELARLVSGGRAPLRRTDRLDDPTPFADLLPRLRPAG